MKQNKPAPPRYAPKIVTESVKFARPGSVFKTKVSPSVTALPVRLDAQNFKSHASVSTSGSSTALKPNPTYTGDMVKGISLVHKSGFMPVFTDEQARDFANMRR